MHNALQLLTKVSSYMGAMLIVVGITGATLINFVPSVLPVFSVLFAFMFSVVLTGAIAWTITHNYSPETHHVVADQHGA